MRNRLLKVKGNLLISFMLSVLCDTDTADLVRKAEFSQPLCTAVQVALINFLKKSGITPNAVGHSSGEIACAYAAGALTVREAILCAYYQGLTTKKQVRKGAMAAVDLGHHNVSSFSCKRGTSSL